MIHRILNVKPAVLIVVAVVLVALFVWQGAAWNSHRREDTRRDSALKVARAQVVDLTSLSAGTVEERLADMSSRTTGSFKRQLDGIAQSFSSTVTKNKIEASGKVAALGVVSFGDDKAEVLLAADAEVDSDEAEATTARAYRIKVSLVLSSGRWLVNGMEFVA
ncbi:hypothetical protein [Aeromicrobium sp.]|uniref:hypothetical protein n=1 Tax=Aeromicrobium sp. TaxID=1871063 RepID=UPI0030BCE158